MAVPTYETSPVRASSDPARVHIPRQQLLVLLALIILGILLRVAIYLGRPSLWVDEARLALNVGSRSYLALIQTLEYDQVAPPLFLWGLKLAAQIGGMNELALRAIPLLAGISVPLLTAALAARMVGYRTALAAGVLTAFAPGLVSQSAQLKPYTTDALVAAVLIATYLGVRRRSSGAGWVSLAVAGALAVWLSASAVFVLAAIGAAVTIDRQAQYRGARLGVFAAWAVSFGVAFWLSYRHGAGNAYLRAYWSPYLLQPWEPGWMARAVASFRDLLLEGFALGMMERSRVPGTPTIQYVWAAALGACVTLGVWDIWRRSGPVSVTLLCGPAVVGFTAATLGLYPAAPRLMLFTLPLLAILLAAGLLSLERLPRAAGVIGIGVITSSLIAGALWCVDLLAARGEEIRPIVRQLRENIRPNQTVYILARALPAWTYYTTNWNRPDTARLLRIAQAASSGGPAFENATQTAQGRVPLRFRYQNRIEIMGTHPGSHWRPGRVRDFSPAPGWAESEARWLRGEGRGLWLVSVGPPGVEASLRLAIESVGGVLRTEYRHGDAALVLYDFLETQR